MTSSSAKALLTSADISRILCVYFNSAPSSINWNKASKDFEAPSVEAFRKAISRMLKKVEGVFDKTTVLNQADISRILCVYFNTAPSAIDWAKATKDFSAPSVEAFRKAISRMMKKIEVADGNGGAADGVDGGVLSANRGANLSNMSKKRQAPAIGEVDGEDEAVSKPKVKRVRRMARKRYKEVAS